MIRAPHRDQVAVRVIRLIQDFYEVGVVFHLWAVILIKYQGLFTALKFLTLSHLGQNWCDVFHHNGTVESNLDSGVHLHPLQQSFMAWSKEKIVFTDFFIVFARFCFFLASS